MRCERSFSAHTASDAYAGTAKHHHSSFHGAGLSGLVVVRTVSSWQRLDSLRSAAPLMATSTRRPPGAFPREDQRFQKQDHKAFLANSNEELFKVKLQKSPGEACDERTKALTLDSMRATRPVKKRAIISHSGWAVCADKGMRIGRDHVRERAGQGRRSHQLTP